MIQYFTTDSDDKVVARTTGCGCCSDELYVETDKEQIIAQLKHNLEVLEAGCGILGISLYELREI